MDVIKSIPLAIKVVLKDPINLLLMLIPTLIALTIYIFSIVWIFKNADYFGVMLQNFIPDPQVAGWLGKLITALFILFTFLIMSWTFIILVGIIAAPFNSMLSSRIEKLLVFHTVSQDKRQTFSEILQGVGGTFKNEAKKLFFILFMTVIALILNLIPLLYPLGIFLISLLLSVQFVDYSWSRHDLSFQACLKDATRNIIPYSFSGFLFLLLVTVPIINALVPAMATAYYTVLWLHRQNKISEIQGPRQERISSI